MIALFDFDGVVMDTEKQYTSFWNNIGEKYLGVRNLSDGIKGQTLVQIYSSHFSGMETEKEEITANLNAFEKEMPYELVPGVLDFMNVLKSAGVPMAIVTSSNAEKMANVYRHYPELKPLVVHIYTSEFFTKSKPDPECFLLAMNELGGTETDTVIFEDSVNGLKAARATGAAVIGLTTSNPEEVVREMSDMCINDFTHMTINAARHVIELHNSRQTRHLTSDKSS